MRHKEKHLYEFTAFCLDPAERTLARHGERIPLAPKAFDTLLILVQHSGHVLTKDELLKAVWPDSFVEENNLTQQISQLRRALAESTDGLTYIETVPKLGYRFTPDVREVVEGEGELMLSKRTRTHIVLREEEEESDESLGEPIVEVEASQSLDAKSPALPATETAVATMKVARNLKRIFAGIAVLAVAITGVLLYRTARPSHSAEHAASVAPVPAVAPVKPRYSVAVFGFRNLSGRAEDDWLSAALAEMLTTELSAGGQLRLVPGEEVRRIKADLKLGGEQGFAKPTLSQIRNRVGADIIVSGSFVEIGPEPNRQIRLDLQLQDTAAGEPVFSTFVTGKAQELFALVSRSGSQLRSKLGAPMLSDLEGAQDQAAMPSTPEAARFYSQGLSRLRLFDAPAAEKLLTRAVTVDPNFALGHSALATAWSALGYDEKAKSEARRALDLSLNLAPQEHLLIAGQYSELTRDWVQAVTTYQQLSGLFPDSVDYGLRLASAQTSAGKGNDALITLEKLRKLPLPTSQDPQIDLAQAAAAESLGDFKQSLEASGRAIRNGEILNERLLIARAWTKKSWALRRLGRPQEAMAGLLEAKRVFAEAGDIQGVGSALRLIGGLQQERGEFAQAERSYQEAIAAFRQIGDRRALGMSINGLAVTHYERGDLRKAKELYLQYLAIEKEVGSRINTAGALGNIANVEDAVGNLTEARRLNEESLKIFAEVGDQRAMGTALGNLGNLLYEQGNLEDAKNKFNEALEIKRKIGYQRGIAYDLSSLSEVLRAEGDLTGAQQKQQEALTLRTQIGEKHNAAASRLYLAVLALENHRPAEAEKIAAETEQEFLEEKSVADEAAAEEVRARSLLEQGEISKAQAAIHRARALAQGAANRPVRFEICATSARISVASKTPPIPATFASVKKDLESALALARKRGYVEYEYKLTLALGAIEFQSGDTDEGRARLETLANEASRRGFRLIARQAMADLKGPAAPTEQSVKTGPAPHRNVNALVRSNSTHE